MIVDCAVYEQGRRRPGKLPLEHAHEACGKNGAFVWIGLYEPSEDEFEAACREFDLHELAVEDAIHAHQRPKLERYGDTLLVVLKTARYVDPTEVIEFGEVLLFVGEDFIISVRHGEAGGLGAVRKEAEQEPRILKAGPAAVLHHIMDRVVDEYEPVIEGVDTDIEELESEVFSFSRENPAERIYKLKREVLEFHRATAPLIEPLNRLMGGQVPHIPETGRTYFRDVHDHLLRVVSQVHAHDDLLTSILEANLTQVAVRQNNDMRRISAWVSIAAIPTLIAAVYGMNFDNMPELHW